MSYEYSSRDDSKKDKVTILSVAVIIVAFLVFFFLKVSGYFDFTHNYDIREITATIDNENAMLMIDRNEATGWNMPTFLGETMVKPGDRITISFDGEREIRGIGMRGEIDGDIVFLTADEREISASLTDTSYRGYSFLESVYTDTLIIEVPKGGEVHWNISELEIW